MALYCSPEYHITQGEYDLVEEHFCEIILKSSHRPRRCCYFKGFSIFSSGWPFCSAEENHFSNFGKGVLEEHF